MNKTDPQFKADEDFIADYCRTTLMRHANGLRMTPTDVLQHELWVMGGYDCGDPEAVTAAHQDNNAAWLHFSNIVSGRRPPSKVEIGKELKIECPSGEPDGKTGATHLKIGTAKLVKHLKVQLAKLASGEDQCIAGYDIRFGHEDPTMRPVAPDPDETGKAFKAVKRYYYRDAARSADDRIMPCSTHQLQQAAQSAAKGSFISLTDPRYKLVKGMQHPPIKDGRPAGQSNAAPNVQRGALQLLVRSLDVEDALRFMEDADLLTEKDARLLMAAKPLAPHDAKRILANLQPLGIVQRARLIEALIEMKHSGYDPFKRRAGGSEAGTRSLEDGYQQRVLKAHDIVRSLFANRAEVSLAA